MSRYNSRRISSKDINSPQAKNHPVKTKAGTSTQLIKCQTEFINSKGELIDEAKDKDVVAKCITIGGGGTFYIKVNRDSIPYDPFDAFYTEASLRLARLMACEPFRLIACSPAAYQSYKTYLVTQNKKYWQDAQRLL